MGIISKSVAHACSGGARGFFKPNDQEYGEAAGVVKFHRDQEKPGRYVSEFRGPARVSCKHAHRQRSLEKQRKRSFDPATCGFGLSSFTGATLVRLLSHMSHRHRPDLTFAKAI